MGLLENLKDIWSPPTVEVAPPWQDRLQEAAYTSPSGKRLTFDYEDVSKNFDKKTSAFDFPGANGTYVQDNGNTGDRYPLRLFFWGDNHDIEAAGFEALLKETGPGVLEHPRYGSPPVVPFGNIKQRDDLKTAANQTIFEVTFWNTIGVAYPLSQDDFASDVKAALDAYNAAAAAQLENQLDVDSAIERASLLDKYDKFLEKSNASLKAIAGTQEDVANDFQTIVDSINRTIDLSVGGPLALASQTKIMIQAPARAVASIQANLDAYGGLARDIFSLDTAEPNGNDSQNTNSFHISELYASGYLTGSIISCLNATFKSKVDALAAAEETLAQMEEYTAWLDDNYEAIGATGDGISTPAEIDTGDGYEQLQAAMSFLTGHLVQISFALPQERSIVLDRERSVIDLVGELYGVIDGRLDNFIQDNNLSGDEILSPGLQRGKEYFYYV